MRAPSCQLYLITPPALPDLDAFATDLEAALGAGPVAALQIRLKPAEDEFEGDTEGFQRRKALWYRRRLEDQGFTALGSHCWLAPALAGSASALERA